MDGMETDDLLDEVQIGQSQRQVRDKSLSPRSKEYVQHLITDVKSKKASLHKDKNGNIVVDYQSDLKKVLAGKDVSQTAKIVSAKNKQEELAYVEAFSEIISKMKELKAPSGINFANDQIYTPKGVYVEKEHFTKTSEILGKGISGNIFVVKDNKTGIDHALKTYLIAEFRDEELKMWIDLNEEDFVPSLLLVRIEGNKIHFHMEKLTEVVSLRKVIDDLLGNIDPDKIKGVSLCFLHGLLTAVDKIHDKRWTHNDLHGGNVMLQKNDLSIDVKIIDFGLGHRMESLRLNDDIKRYESDILWCFRLFSAMYLGEEFNDIYDLKKNGLKKLTESLEHYEEDNRKEILQIFDVFLEITSINSHKFGKTKEALENVSEVLEKNNINKGEMLEHAAKKLFPEKITPVNSMDLDDFTDSPREGLFLQALGNGTIEQESDKINSVGSTDSIAPEVVRDILEEMSIRPRK
ncbi:hypothetical protein LOTGIDRAFT_236872 [Lottia gigantea]|uniref:Protein kinase domain-containing protein n=1 Tax=Lottia gigantea TaxID=225164 RepID=V3YY91_LOTGI|nr:hypothetical protein LOTGIDRAFT_236872 [Lottia gigantea]ESO83098.1 hypothetical protein LOTGIDRAFT_236872 [Lottia gigantea]